MHLKLSTYYTNRAAAYWREGLDTAQIAKQMNMSEAHIWNNMDAVKGKQQHGKGGT